MNYIRRFLIFPLTSVMLLPVATLTAQNKEEFNGLVFYVPQGLTITKTANTFTMTDATLNPPENFSITINNSTFSLKKIEKSFPTFWRESLVMDGFDIPPAEPQFVRFANNAGWDCFRGGKAVSYTEQSPSQFYHLTVVKKLGVTLRIVTKASSQEVFQRKIPALMQLVGSIDFKKQTPPQQNVYTGTTAAGSPGSNNSGYSSQSSNTSVQLQTYALYMSVQGDLLTNAEIAVLGFFPDGTVYSDVPEKGFVNFNVQEQRSKTPETFGTYTSSANGIIIKMNGDPNGTAYNTRPDGNLQSANNPALVFKKMESLNNYRLEGSYLNKRDNNNNTITFTRDGSFTDNGVIKTIMSSANNVNPGSGNYSILQNSLTLQYNDGRAIQLCMYMMPEDYQQESKPPKILINNYVLTNF